MEILTNLDPNAVITIIAGIIAVITSIVALIQKIKAGKYIEALDDSKKVSTNLMETIDDLKNIVEPSAREPVMRGLGTKLEIAGLKEQVDEALTQMGLNNKA